MYMGHNGGDTKSALLITSAAIAALCTALLCAALLNFSTAILKAIKAKHQWYVTTSSSLTFQQFLCFPQKQIVTMLTAVFHSGQQGVGVWWD